MSLILSSAAIRTYDALKARAGSSVRRSDARDTAVLAAVTVRLSEMINAYRLNAHDERGNVYVFWTEVSTLVDAGVFDDLLDRL